jgi:hypothetical protein
MLYVSGPRDLRKRCTTVGSVRVVFVGPLSGVVIVDRTPTGRGVRLQNIKSTAAQQNTEYMNNFDIMFQQHSRSDSVSRMEDGVAEGAERGSALFCGEHRQWKLISSKVLTKGASSVDYLNN